MESGNQLGMESARNRAAGELGDPLFTKNQIRKARVIEVHADFVWRLGSQQQKLKAKEQTTNDETRASFWRMPFLKKKGQEMLTTDLHLR